MKNLERFSRGIKFCLFLVLVWATQAGAYYDLGSPSGYVNDYAGVLKPEQRQSLEDKLVQFERESGHELSVVIVSDLRGDTVDNFAVELFSQWGIGKEGTDNGVLILIAIEERKMRIEVGYGLEHLLTDAESSWIIRDILQPKFREGNYYQGLEVATDKVMALAKGEVVPELAKEKGFLTEDSLGGILTFLFFIPLWLAAILGRSRSWWAGGVLGGVIGLLVTIFVGLLYAGIIALGVLIPLGLLFDYVVSKRYKAAKKSGSYPWWIGGGSSGGGFGGGGFGGFGGGRSGGGGASGGW